ncbi:MAG: GH92 family glycosyl hydrolase [Tannerellaceae bacterium]|jgi:putative alpha-1,2-mannosidase|nr:GH92 family glycosyl hydrolase [Tannerellaceae bacterium]
MKTQKFKLSLFMALITVVFQCCTESKPATAPVDDVYMYIGTINPKTRGTTPVIKVPGGTVGLFPAFTPGMTDWYFADKIYGFPLGVGSLMANTGQMKVGSRENASRFDHDLETATPYYYQALLEDPEINTEFTVTENTVVFRFTLPENVTSNLFLNLAGNAGVEIKDNTVIEGQTAYRGTRGGEENKNYFHIQLSKPFASCGTWRNDTVIPDSKTQKGFNTGFYAGYPAASSKETVELRIGLSRSSIDEARRFVASEAGALSFNQLKEKARQLWNEELSLIKVKGGTDKQRRLFYTTLHRTRALRMGNVWDTYRCAYPLQSLIKPEETNKTIQNWLARYDETGWLPSSGAMIGHHSTPVIVDAYFRGLRDYDVEKAYEAMKKNALEATMIPWKDAMYITELEQCYFDNGFYPALPVRKDFNPEQQTDKYERLPYQTRWLPEPGVEEWVKEVDSWHRRQSVSVTLEHCYDDWCLAQMAKELGKEDDYRLFMQRAHNYQNLFKPAIGMMAPKSADGQWIEPFDPKYSGGFAGEGYFAEGNSWMYTWHVQHDVQGLINLMGGCENFVAKLNELFITGHRMDKLQFLAQFPDMTGLMGMYSHGNEPDFHIPYLYNYAGQPWMTQQKVRQILELWYDATPFGLSGDEDGGSMSSWYVLSSTGLYPQCPGRPVFDICSPVFEEVSINVGNGKTFVVEARNVSAQNKYIQSATLNGTPHNQAWISHSDIVQGGTLVFQMGPRPNKDWGSSPDVRPPSMSAPVQ